MCTLSSRRLHISFCPFAPASQSDWRLSVGGDGDGEVNTPKYPSGSHSTHRITSGTKLEFFFTFYGLFQGAPDAMKEHVNEIVSGAENLG